MHVFKYLIRRCASCIVLRTHISNLPSLGQLPDLDKQRARHPYYSVHTSMCMYIQLRRRRPFLALVQCDAVCCASGRKRDNGGGPTPTPTEMGSLAWGKRRKKRGPHLFGGAAKNGPSLHQPSLLCPVYSSISVNLLSACLTRTMLFKCWFRSLSCVGDNDKGM